jgi:hypothetical protein
LPHQFLAEILKWLHGHLSQRTLNITLMNEIIFMIGVLLCIFFFIEEKKCRMQIERSELLEGFLNDETSVNNGY